MRLITHLTQRVRPAADDGFTMLMAIGALGLVLLLSVTAFAAVNGDLPLSLNDSQQKQAYSAAQAGLQQYLFDLNQDNQYWAKCVPTPANGINLAGSTANRRTVPGTSTESYAIELMPATGQTTYTQCSTADPVTSMIQSTPGFGSGTIRVRSTGFAGKVQRTIVASVRRQTFLDYAWFTKFETDDPIVQAVKANYVPPNGTNWSNALAGAQNQCGVNASGVSMYYRANRTGTYFYKDPSTHQTYSCDIISFINGDNIQGPMHTDDEFAICGAPTFGRNASDFIEIGAAPTGETSEGQSGCSAGAQNKGSRVNNTTILDPPPSNQSLKSIATLSFTGTTCINLGVNTISETQPALGASCESAGLSWTAYPYPTNGVLYVANSAIDACTAVYDVINTVYTVGSGNKGCGTVYVHGTYNIPLTIGAENDIVIDGSVTHQAGVDSAVLGLVANGFVRIYHPATYDGSGKCTGNATGSMTSPSVDAAIMSVQHSFIADNYTCGNPLGTLTVHGSVAQLARGGVGTSSGGTVSNGYLKNYVYDDRLRYEEPPHFLDPVKSAWRVIRANECAPGPDPNNPTDPTKDKATAC